MKAVDYIRKGWTQGANARDRRGNVCPSGSREAARWCLEGALVAAYDDSDLYTKARDKLRRVIGHYGFANWNDDKGRTKREVIEAMEKAGV